MGLGFMGLWVSGLGFMGFGFRVSVWFRVKPYTQALSPKPSARLGTQAGNHALRMDSVYNDRFRGLGFGYIKPDAQT